MPATATRSEGKSAFVRRVLQKDPRADAADVNEAWRAAGMPGEISAGLVNHLRHRMGVSGNPRGRTTTDTRRGRRPVKVQSGSNGRTPTIGRGRTNDLMTLEVEIDRRLMKVATIGPLPGIEEGLSAARRWLYSGMVDVSRAAPPNGRYVGSRQRVCKAIAAAPPRVDSPIGSSPSSG